MVHMQDLQILALWLGVIQGKPFNYTEEVTCPGYDACHPVYSDKLNVHLVPHSHDDVGWLYTVDQYYSREVQHIITSVVGSLLDNPDRRFIQVETAFFYIWWNEQTEDTKTQVRQLINEGRLEITNGAWAMNDEADVHYQSTVDQFTLGLRFIEDVLGKCARPRVGWQIDPFGHSREHASLLAQMGMDGVFFARIDYRDKKKRNAERTGDLLWKSSANLGASSNIFTTALYNHYSAPKGFCFDTKCHDTKIVTESGRSNSNWESRVMAFANYTYEQSLHYPTNNIIITMGEDFQWQKAEQYYINLDKLIEGFKKFNPTPGGKEINIIYSTPSCYAKAVRDAVEANDIELDVKTDDFFPYADHPNSVWSGYFTSRPTSKRFERFANNLHQISKQILALGKQPYNGANLLSQAMGVMQHHDAISGTEKTMVEKDYHKRITKGIEIAISDISTSLSSILGLENDLNLKSCLLSNVSICAESEKDEFTVLLYNPLARTTSHYIQIPVNDGTWKITGPSGEEVENQLTNPIRDFSYISKVTKDNILPKVLFFRAEDLPPLGYKLYKFEKVSNVSSSVKEEVMAVNKIGFEDRYINVDHNTGLLKSITINGVTLNVKQDMMFYKGLSRKSGAYIFRPDTAHRDAISFGDVKTSVLINDGNVVREIRQVWKDWVTQIIRVYKEEDFIEFDWAVGPIDIKDHVGKELITRYTTNLGDTDGVFYTDSNGREIIYRQKDYRPTFRYTNEEPQAGNYYPVNTKILIKDQANEFAVLTDRSEGGSSLNTSEVELMLIRAATGDDGKGVVENLNEQEFNQGLVARGSHFVTLGSITEGNGGRTVAAVERDIAQRKLLQPWVFYTSEDIPVKEKSFLKNDLPPNVHLLTLESWSDSNTFLIRLEHILEKNEDPILSQEVTVDLSDLFDTFTIVSLKEFMLAANTPLEESHRFEWPQVAEHAKKTSPLNKQNRLARDEADLNITLAPMQIRTFVATVEFA